MTLELVGALNAIAGTSGLEIAGAAAAILNNLAVVGDTQPSAPNDNALWYDTANEVLKRWDGSAWQTAPHLNIPDPAIADPGALTNNLASQTVDGILETMTGLDTISQAALSRNLSELAAKYESLRQALLDADILTA